MISPVLLTFCWVSISTQFNDQNNTAWSLNRNFENHVIWVSSIRKHAFPDVFIFPFFVFRLFCCLSNSKYNWQVNYALGALYYLCNSSTKEEILKPEVVKVIRKYAAAGAVNMSFSNLANAFLDRHVKHENLWKVGYKVSSQGT